MRGRLQFLLLSVSAGLLTLPAGAAAGPENSPFLPAGTSAIQTSAQEANSLELRGMMSGSQGSRYYIYDPARKRGVWTGLHEAEGAFVIVADDPAGPSVEIRMGDGRRLRLQLAQAKIKGSDLDGGSSSALAQGANSGGASMEAEPVPTEADKKWDKYQDETAQRRAALALALVAARK